MIYSSVTNVRCVPVRRALNSFRFGAALALGFAVFALFATPAHSGKLPLERLFAAPDLSGPTLRGVKISPNGKLIAYLKGREDDKDRYDLWAFDVTAARHRLLVDSRTLAGADRALSAEEEARRERAAHFGVLGDRRIQLRARRPSPADSAERRPVRLRPGAQRCRCGAPSDDHGRVRNRRTFLAALRTTSASSATRTCSSSTWPMAPNAPSRARAVVS